MNKPLSPKPAMPAKKFSKVIKAIQFDKEFRPVTVGPIVKNRVMTAYDEAKGIILTARSEAERLRQEAESIRKQAALEKEAERERGYQQGLQAGLAELSEKIIEAEFGREKILNEAEPQIIRMVMDIAEKVIGREIEKGAIVDIVKQAISQAVGRKITVRINPIDIPAMKEREKDLLIGLESTQSVSIKEDEQIPPGGCVVETEKGAVDARLETQLEAIKKALGLDVV